MKERYYFWVFSRAYGWQQLGRNCGYRSLKELELDIDFSNYRNKKIKVMKARPIRVGSLSLP